MPQTKLLFTVRIYNTVRGLTLLLVSLVAPITVAEALWKPEAITYELKQSHPLVGEGLVLELRQDLSPGESGWKKMRIDVPENWSNAKLEMKQGTVFVHAPGRTYFVNSENMGVINFAILDGGTKGDKELLELWSKHASSRW